MTQELLDALWHAIGMTRRNYRRSLAWWLDNDNHRNFYCVPVAHPGNMVQLESLGLIFRGRAINDGQDCYYHVSEKGIEVARDNFPRPATAATEAPK